ncbi:hypothetical protein RJT34_11211 [Clitoria ternatea]|uniref:Uncharacterized protein n=1 Tax=Clitoria ternatea TaxID=43366 RepID=A0AAN9JM28_CLITE
MHGQMRTRTGFVQKRTTSYMPKSHTQTKPTRPIYAIFAIIFNLHLVLESPVIPFKRSVKELRDFGIRFRKSDTDDLKDVTFDDDNGVLRLPHIQVDDNTRYIFLNLIAFEHLHVEAGNEVTSYVYFMDSIIDNEVDVEILHKKDIIRNGLESNIAVAQMFNSLAKDITVVGADIKFEQEMMADYCRKWWKKWRANLLHTYFRNPWSTISFYAAIFLFALTIVQTVFTVLQYYEPKGPSSSPSVDRPPRH